MLSVMNYYQLEQFGIVYSTTSLINRMCSCNREHVRVFVGRFVSDIVDTSYQLAGASILDSENDYGLNN